MSDSLAKLRHKLNGAIQLGAVVRAMKAVAATSIGQYEAAVTALGAYAACVELGLGLCLREERAEGTALVEPPARSNRPIGALVIGSDQGLVGQFNEAVAELVLTNLRTLPGPKTLWVIGERLCPLLEHAGWRDLRRFPVPSSTAAITSVVSDVQLEVERYAAEADPKGVYVFYNRALSAARYGATVRQLLPLDTSWSKGLAAIPWPGGRLAQLLAGARASLSALLHEYLFITLFRACAESLASENASRLEAMQRAEKNIESLSETLQRSINRLRQSSIDEELFEVIAGFNAQEPRSWL